MIANRILFFVPVIASFVLGGQYVRWSGGAGWRKAAVIAVFLGAAYLQFFSSYVLAGVLTQTGLAMLLELRRLYWEAPMALRRDDHGPGDFPA